MEYLVYLCIMTLACYFYLNKSISKKKQMILLAFIFLITIIFMGLREVSVQHSVGIDSIVYRLSFENTTINFIDSWTKSGFEPGIVIIHWIVKIFSNNYYIVSIIEVTLMLACELYLLSKFKGNKFSIIPIFFTLLNLIEGACVIRNSLAIHIGFIVFIELSNQKYFKALILAFLATCFHISGAILFLIIFNVFIMNKYLKSNFKKYVILLVAEFFAAFSVIQIVIYLLKGTRYSEYFTSDTIAVNTYLITTFVLVIAFYLWNKIMEENNKYMLICSILPITFICLPLQFGFSASYRFLLYITPLMYITIGCILEISWENIIKKDKRFLFISIFSALLLFCCFKAYRFLTINLESYGLNNYRNAIVEIIKE